MTGWSYDGCNDPRHFGDSLEDLGGPVPRLRENSRVEAGERICCKDKEKDRRKLNSIDVGQRRTGWSECGLL